jgi:hypothetical protein
MNLVNFENKLVSDDKWFLIKDYRKIDHYKIFTILENMFNKLCKIHDMSFKINHIDKIENSKVYLSEYANYMDIIEIIIRYKKNNSDEYSEANLKLQYPQLVDNNFFVLNGSIYIPLMFLERCPIDRINEVDDNGINNGKILLNILPSFNLTFDLVNKQMFYRGKKSIDINVFFYEIFKEEPEYLTYLFEQNIIEKVNESTTPTEMEQLLKSLDIKSLDFKYNDKDITIREFFDEFLLLDYFKEMFERFYGVSDIKSIIKKIVELYLNNVIIDMSDLKNRRIVISEYLCNPIFEFYLRFLKNLNLYIMPDNVKDTPFIPTMNEKVILTSGFREMSHGGTYVNISLPYLVPLLNKVSQQIYIVGEKIPRSWTANHKSAYGKICPISVSAQNMGENLVFTSSVRLDYYGLIEGTGSEFIKEEET